jgi:hypothetical protein
MSDPRSHRPDLWPPQDGPYRQTSGPSAQAKAAHIDVARLETTRLSPLPAPPARPASLTVPLPAPSFPPTRDDLSLRQRQSTPQLDLIRHAARETAIATAEQAARLARAEAADVAVLLQTETASYARQMQRWRALAVGQPVLSRAEASERASLEETLPPHSLRLARLRQRWMALVEQARLHEQRVRDLQAHKR